MDIVDNDYIKELTKILESVGERIEGNLVCDITPTNWVINDNIDKIKNLQYLCKNKKKIIEIGVNACHSLLLMLLINPEAEYLLFDLNCHKYTEPAFNYIKSQFPSTKINIIFGDSTKTMHKFIVDNQTELHSYDLIHIDGGHTIDIFSHDYNNSKQLSVNNGVVVFDDYDYDRIYTFIQKMIAQKEIIEYTDSNIIRTRLHFVYTYL
jgi:predicted O-methyltransferase YrrM